MNIHFNETELRQAVRTYLESKGFDLCNKEVEIYFTAGRRGRGHYAKINVAEKAQVAMFEEAAFSAEASEKLEPIIKEPVQPTEVEVALASEMYVEDGDGTIDIFGEE